MRDPTSISRFEARTASAPRTRTAIAALDVSFCGQRTCTRTKLASAAKKIVAAATGRRTWCWTRSVLIAVLEVEKAGPRPSHGLPHVTGATGKQKCGQP